MQVLNLNLAKHPMNWLVIGSMVLILAFLAHLLISFFSGSHPGQTNVAGPGTTTATQATNS